MKKLFFLFGLLIIITGGVLIYTFLSETKLDTIRSTIPVTTTLRGSVQKIFNTEVNYTHVLKTDNSTIHISSSSVTLDDYIGGTVEITGHYVDSILYIDTIKEIK